MEDQPEQINPDDLTFVAMDDNTGHPVEAGSFTGFEPGQKVLHLTGLGGRPHMRIVTIEKEAIIDGGIGLVVYVKEYSGYLEASDLTTIESIQDMINDYTEQDARRWRAIDDGIIPAVMLNNEEIDKIIDDNEEWCKAYEDRQEEWSRENAEARVLDQIPEDQRHTNDDDECGPSAVHGSSSTCQP